VVVSPLVSLMQDQVHALNATVRAENEPNLATFLGSGQSDASAEGHALRGDFALVYVSPEKLLSFGFLDALARVQSQVLGFAIDEAHCVSEWGSDFRQEYAKLGRIREQMPGIPIMALTATASPHIRGDVIQKLKFKNTLLCKGSFDRPNLYISVKRRPSVGEAAREVANTYTKSPGATIVYVPTTKGVEEFAYMLKSILGNDFVGLYHAKLSMNHRDETHNQFLTGEVPIIVATVAFGMGIDKPDVRRVVHFGPPKTFEAYVQQIGRAGRDGLKSYCTLYQLSSDFTKYSSDFYVGSLSPEARKITLESTARLEKFCDTPMCRRYQILKAFEEPEPDWGRSCGDCDVCRLYDRSSSQGLQAPQSSKRDFTTPVLSLLSVIGGKGSSMTKLVSAASKLQKSESTKRYTQDELKEILGMLVSAGYVKTEIVSFTSGGGSYGSHATGNRWSKSSAGYGGQERDITYKKYTLTSSGKVALATAAQIWLVPSPYFIDQEVIQNEKAMMRHEELRALGVDPALVPESEIRSGSGPSYDGFVHWHRTLNQAEKSGRIAYVEQLQEMHQAIIEWRQQEAKRAQTAPSTIIPDYLVCKLAYTRPTTVEALRSVGIRVANLQPLAQLIARRSEEVGLPSTGSKRVRGEGSHDTEYAKFPSGMVKPPVRWKLAPNVQDRRKLLAWELSCNQLAEGHTLESIALKGSTKPRQVRTIVVHVLQGLQHGLAADLSALADAANLNLSRAEWDMLESTAVATNFNPKEDKSGFWKGDFARHALGEELITKADKTPDELNRVSDFYQHLDWWLTLRRCGIVPSFVSTSKRGKSS